MLISKLLVVVMFTSFTIKYVTNYSTFSLLNDDALTTHAGSVMIVSFLTVADWSTRHRLKVKVSRDLLCMVGLLQSLVIYLFI